MQRNLLLSIFYFTTLSIFSQQQWATIGSSWFYNLQQDYEYGYIEIVSKKDTVIENKICKYLIAEKNVYAAYGGYIREKVDSYITYQNNNKIYLYQNNKFSMLYDFNPSIGDVWDVSEIWNTYNTLNTGHSYLDTLNCKKGKVRVDSIKNITLNNKQLKSIYTSPYDNSSMEYSGVIVEGIGCLGYMMPISKCNQHIDSWYPYQIRCYNSFDFNYTWSDKSCNYITGIEEIKSKSVSVSRIASDGYISIKVKNEDFISPINIKIYSSDGMLIFNKNTFEKCFEIAANEFLSRGMYLIVIKDNSSTLYKSKFII